MTSTSKTKTDELKKLMTDCASSYYDNMDNETVMTCNVDGLIECLSKEGYRRETEVADEIFSEILALCKNAEEKLPVIFNGTNREYKQGYANSVKHFTENMERLRQKYTQESRQEVKAGD